MDGACGPDLKQDLLREPNHHERKSNQKEEARGCTVVFPVSHFRPLSQFRAVARLVARSRRFHWLRGTSLPETEPRMIMPLCERFARVVPPRAVNERLRASPRRHAKARRGLPLGAALLSLAAAPANCSSARIRCCSWASSGARLGSASSARSPTTWPIGLRPGDGRPSFAAGPRFGHATQFRPEDFVISAIFFCERRVPVEPS